MQRRVPALEQRIAEIISAYDAQGNHRTGTAVDEASAEWLSKQVYNIGIEAALEPFALSRVDPRSCFLRIDNRRIEGVPLFDAAFTGAEGVRGKLGPLGSDAEIGVGEAIGSQAASAAEARRSRHKAVVLLTRGGRPGLVDRRICQTFAASPAEPGELLLAFRSVASGVNVMLLIAQRRNYRRSYYCGVGNRLLCLARETNVWMLDYLSPEQLL